MKTLFEQSLIQFNARVLYNGIPTEEHPTIEYLQNKLMFNQIYMSNMDEMFGKYSMTDSAMLYMKGLHTVFKNITKILKDFKDITGCELSHDNSFERRYVINSELVYRCTTTYIDPENTRFSFTPGEIYYVGWNEVKDTISISEVDPRCHIYKKALSYGNTFWKTDECILAAVARKVSGRVVAIKVTSNRLNSSMIEKVEFNGDPAVIKRIANMFGYATIIGNPFMYTNDIKYMISSFATKVNEMQNDNLVDIEELLTHDQIIEYPKDSFLSYLEFLRSVTDYEDTSEIYLTLYRIGNDPSIFYVLRDAVIRGIKVTVNMELYASGESINQFWADEMVRAGIHVTTYESGRLKVHSKLTLVKMNNGISIAQIGTGNYNSSTASQYTDLSLITSDSDICNAAEKVFKIFDGKVDQRFSKNMLVTRYNAREELYKLIDREAAKGGDGYIFIKCNSLDDKEVIKHLDKAANAGCEMYLIIRGACTWIPDKPNVSIKSIIWAKLEHSRVYCFGKTDPNIYIGSLDLVTHKLDCRIETLAKVTNIKTMVTMCEYINRYVTNKEGSWKMDMEGNYHLEKK